MRVTLVESFVVHLLSIGQVGSGCDGKHPLLVSFLSNVPKLNSRRHSLPMLEIENLSDPLYVPVYPKPCCYSWLS
jgi:hypothetical protein